jgi:hypothetical protein
MPQAITRTTDDSRWLDERHRFVKTAHTAKRPLLVDYLFEPPDHIVPQRLYRYDVFADYLSRHRDDFEFGYDLITHAEYITTTRTYGVYVIELDRNTNHVYVGQTWYLPHERLAQHNTGFAAFHAARPFKRGARGTLRPDLYRHLPRYRSQAQAEAMEAALAMELKKIGFRVEGGH